MCAQQMSAVASDLAAQHFKNPGMLFYSCGVGWSLRYLCLSDSHLSHQPPPPRPSLPLSRPQSWLSVTLADCVMRTSARAQINFDLLIPFEKKKEKKKGGRAEG